MAVPAHHPRSRKAVCYIGSALFLATGVVAVADPTLIPPGWNTCVGCETSRDWGRDCDRDSGTCSSSKVCGNCKCAPTFSGYADVATCELTPVTAQTATPG